MNEQRSDTNIALIGCGKMGSALLAGWQSAPLSLNFTIIDPHAPQADFKTIEEAAEKLHAADMVIFAAKPQTMKDICAALKPHLPASAALLSIAAGTSIAAFEKYFGQSQPIIRTMPNTPAAIGKGATIGVANPRASEEHKSLTATLLSSNGLFQWIEDEALMNAVTALSGSGPAYLFYLIETLSKAGAQLGLPADLAETLARQTVIGSAALAESEANTPAAVLRENVTSPGGTTAAALEILMNGEMDEIFATALKAAVKRGEDLDS